MSNASNNPKALFSLAKQLLGNSDAQHLPRHTCDQELAADFSKFFIDKIDKTHASLTTDNDQSSAPFNDEDGTTCDGFFSLAPVSEGEIKKLIASTGCKSCELDPLPGYVFSRCVETLLPVLTTIINTSLMSGLLRVQLPVEFPMKL